MLFKSTKATLQVTQYHLELRMREAERLIRTEHLPVTETAKLFGFNSNHHFSRRYRDFFRHAPSKTIK